MASALKNVLAVATGIVEGFGLGFNSRAALITRGLHEMTRLGVALGARASTFAGPSRELASLVLTCTGTLSRNRALGIKDRAGAHLGGGVGREGDSGGGGADDRECRRPGIS